MRTRLIGVGVAVVFAVAAVWVGARTVDDVDSFPALSTQTSRVSRLGDGVRTAHETLVTMLAGTRTGQQLSVAEKTRRFAAIVEQVRAIEQRIPRDSFDLESVARGLGPDAVKHHQWVREHTKLVSYRGSLRGAKGTLMDRRGNSLDRSLLLAGLLTAQNVQVRLARAHLTPEQLSMLTKQSAGVGTKTNEAGGPSANSLGIIESLAKETGSDANQVRRQLQRIEDLSRETAENLRRHAAAQTAMLIKGLGISGPAPGASATSSLEALEDHWWVQWEDGGAWKDLDPDLSVAGKVISTPDETIDPNGLADDLHHSIQVRVIVEKWDGTSVEETQAVTVGFRPSEVIGDSLRLQHVPVGWPKNVQSSGSDWQRQFKDESLKQREWLPVLTIGERRITGASVLDTGDLNSQPGAKPAAGGLVDAIGGGGPARAGVLTAEWIEYEITSPGRDPQIIRREVFDLLGPAARAAGQGPRALTEQSRLLRSLSLLSETEILPLACQFSAEFVTHSTASRFIAAESALANVIAGDTRPDQLNQTPVLPGPLHGLAVARGGLGRGDGSLYLDVPNVLSRHTFPRVNTDGTIGLAMAIDIVANEVAAVTASPAEAFNLRVEQGVFDANLEAMWLGSDVGAASTSELFSLADAGRGWIAVRTAADLKKITAPQDIKARLEADLRAGFVLLVPNATDSPAATGWWRVHPQMGHTMSFGDRGWGQAMVELATGITAGATGMCLLGTLLLSTQPGFNAGRSAAVCVLIAGLGFGGAAMGAGIAAGGFAGGATFMGGAFASSMSALILLAAMLF